MDQSKSSGGNSVCSSTLTREAPERGEEQEVLQGESDELSSPTSLQDDSTRDAEANNDMWSTTGDFIDRHHVEPRVKLYMPREESFLILWSTSTLPEQRIHHWMFCWRKYWWLLERRWRKRIIRCMDRLHKIHFLERKATWWIFMVRVETYKETNNLKTWWFMAGYVDLMQRRKSKTKMGLREAKTR